MSRRRTWSRDRSTGSLLAEVCKTFSVSMLAVLKKHPLLYLLRTEFQRNIIAVPLGSSSDAYTFVPANSRKPRLVPGGSSPIVQELGKEGCLVEIEGPGLEEVVSQMEFEPRLLRK